MQQAAKATAIKNLTEEEFEKMVHGKWLKMLTESAGQIAQRPAAVEELPSELRGELLLPQPLVSPVRGWIDGVTPPVQKEGRTIELSLPGVVGLFKWTLLAETRHAKRSRRLRVERPDPSKLEIERLLMFVDGSTGARIPWNTGLKRQIELGYLGAKYDRVNAPPESKKVIPHLEPISYLSDANKLAWMRAFLGWAHKAMLTQNPDPQADMSEHTGLIHFLTEMYSRLGVKGAKPMSECGQGIAVYAGGKEIRTGREGLMTSDWGNKLFLTAGKKVADSLFTGASSKSESDLGDRMESALNLSFWAKEGAFGCLALKCIFGTFVLQQQLGSCGSLPCTSVQCSSRLILVSGAHEKRLLKGARGSCSSARVGCQKGASKHTRSTPILTKLALLRPAPSETTSVHSATSRC